MAPNSLELWRPLETLRGEIDWMFDDSDAGFGLRGEARFNQQLPIRHHFSYQRYIEVNLADGVLAIKGQKRLRDGIDCDDTAGVEGARCELQIDQLARISTRRSSLHRLARTKLP